MINAKTYFIQGASKAVNQTGEMNNRRSQEQNRKHGNWAIILQ
jgi:hypothetical protein